MVEIDRNKINDHCFFTKYNLIHIPENSLEHLFIAKNIHRWVNDASSVRRIDGEMDVKNDRTEINDFCFLHYTTSYAS